MHAARIGLADLIEDQHASNAPCPLSSPERGKVGEGVTKARQFRADPHPLRFARDLPLAEGGKHRVRSSHARPPNASCQRRSGAVAAARIASEALPRTAKARMAATI